MSDERQLIALKEWIEGQGLTYGIRIRHYKSNANVDVTITIRWPAASHDKVREAWKRSVQLHWRNYHLDDIDDDTRRLVDLLDGLEEEPYRHG